MSKAHSTAKSEGIGRYSIGIDLGTTNSVLAYVDLHSDPDQLVHQVMAIPQLTNPGSVEDRWQLPSFIYQPHESEINEAELALPWNPKPIALTGELARNLGSKTPIRLISSAKSWLCHGGIDRRAKLLPIDAPEEIPKISPLQAAIDYLAHLRAAWNHTFPEHRIEEQEVSLTVPASFDPAARELTAEAAKAVGFNHLTLLEEPQAAVYSWIKANGEAWRKQVTVGDIILVVDIGGGTTDLSLIAVTEQDGNLELNRIAVGDHILLGGDNMDLALAYRVKAKLAAEGKELQAWQIQALTHGCRHAKEQLLSDEQITAVPIVVPNRGSKMIGGTLRTELTRDEVVQTLVEGFFPLVSIEEQPRTLQRGALTKLGLPYAQDAGVTRHLAAFLRRQAGAAEPLLGVNTSAFIQPTAILFNGGVLKSSLLAERLLAIVNSWLTEVQAEPARLLTGTDLDLAVARGAAYYGYVRQGKGVRIRGGLANAYYVGIESAMPAVPGMEPPIQALCVAPFGMEEGTEAAISQQEFGLVVGEPVRFRFFGSNLRREDQAGVLLEDWAPDQLDELPELEVNLPVEGRQPGSVVPVNLLARVTEVGTLVLEALPREGEHREGGQRWKVEFDVRNKAQS